METTISTKNTMSSREIAALTGKRHDHVLRDCDKLNDNYEKLTLPKIGVGNYHDTTGRTLRCYNLSRMQTFDLMTGYNIELRIKVNRRWEELETKVNQIDFSNPNTVLQLAQNWAEEQKKREIAEKQVELQAKELRSAAPKVEYYEDVMQSESAIATNVIAKELGMSAISLNKKLHQMGIIYKSGGSWVLYHKYQDKGYHKTKTHHYTDSHGQPQTNIQMYWTEKGRKFVLSKIKVNA